MASDDIKPGGDPFSQAMAIAALNAASQQQQIAITAQAATTMGVSTLYSVDTASLGIATKKLLSK